MRIEEIVWLSSVVDKLAVKHGVETGEVEEALTNRPKFRFVEKGEREGENVYMALGRRTPAGISPSSSSTRRRRTPSS